MKSYATATNSLSALDPLSEVRMRPDQRREARASMRQAEMLTDMLLRVNHDLRHALGFVWRGIVAAAQRSKSSASAPEWRLP